MTTIKILNHLTGKERVIKNPLPLRDFLVINYTALGNIFDAVREKNGVYNIYCILDGELVYSVQEVKNEI